MNDVQPDPSTTPSEDLTCPRCQRGRLTDRHCKSICELCGYVESCEDIFPVRPPAGPSPVPPSH